MQTAHTFESNFRCRSSNVIEFDEGDAGQQWNKRSAIFWLTGRGQGTEGASVKGIVHGKDARLWARFASVPVVRLRKGAGEFERSFPCFGAAVAKEGAVKAGDLRQQLREFGLIFMKKRFET